MHLSEDQIERRIETMFNALDKVFLAGHLTNEQYHEETKAIDAWAEMQYRKLEQINAIRED